MRYGAPSAGSSRPRGPWQFALRLARRSMLPPPDAPKWLRVATVVLRGARRLRRRLEQDRLGARSAALAFHTLLSVVPAAALALALVVAFGGVETVRGLLEAAVAHYLPGEALAAVDALAPLVETVDPSRLGLVGLLALVPLAAAIVGQVDAALADVFRTRPPRRWLRMPLYALLVTAVPAVALVATAWRPLSAAPASIERHLLPLLVSAVLLTGAFRFFSSGTIRWSAAAAGGMASAVALLVARVGFDAWARQLLHGTRLAWGTLAFVPVVLLWVWLAWYLALLGAELAAVVEEMRAQLAIARGTTRRAPAPRWRRRLRWRRFAKWTGGGEG
ncbi:MAG: YihY family inner membrane protein [Myxococcota bacterium]|nr:YihY family inner membrane protein [Myxococcota bacterium]MDW8362348.1 YhjD/YihY/BrkB family envelope integrity protein [Myxococcales bacterium]